MLDNFLNKSKPINFIVLLAIFFIAFCFVSYSNFFVDNLSLIKLSELGLMFILFICIFFFFNFIITKNNLTFDNSYAYYIFTLTTICILPNLLSIHILCLVLVHFLFLRKIYSIYSSKNIIQKLYDCGFWLGVSLIIKPFLVVYIILIYTAIYLYQKITIRTLFTPIVGIITPILLYFTYCFWYDNTQDFIDLFSISFKTDIQIYLNSKIGLFFLVLIIMMLISFILKTPKVISINNTFKKSWLLVGFHFIVSISFTLFLENKTGYEIIFSLLTISVIITNGIELIDKKIAKNFLLFFLLIGTIIFSFLL